jgi:hypothetical protein
MSDWLKIFAEMSFDNLFVIAGLAFLTVGVIGRVSGRIDAPRFARLVAAFVGAALIGAGVYIHRGHVNADIEHSAARTVPTIKEVEAQENFNPSAARDSGSSTQSEHKGLNYFSGKWKNVDSETRGLTTLNVRTNGNSVWVHAWVRCHPNDCDWGEVPATAFPAGATADSASDAQKVTAVFQTSFSNTILDLSPAGGDALEADTQTRFSDNSGCSPYSANYTLRR